MAINVYLMALMPISQSVAWYGFLTSKSSVSLYRMVYVVTSFYCAWALYNRYFAGVTKELGQYTMGLLAICTYFQKYIPSVLATTLVLSNFLLPSYFILIQWSPTELARNVKNDTSSLAVTWAIVFKLYFCSNILLWSLVLYKFYTYRHEIDSGTYTVLPTSTTNPNMQ